MTKDDVKQLLRRKMKRENFHARNGRYFKKLDDTYLIGVWLDHHPFCEAYYIEYGAVYLPDSIKMPFKGWCDWDFRFVFPNESDDHLHSYPIEDLNVDGLIDYFDYSIGTPEMLSESLDQNIARRLSLLYNKEYVLNLYRNNWILFRMVSYDTVDKICRLAGLDRNKVYEIRDSNVTQWPTFEENSQ